MNKKFSWKVFISFTLTFAFFLILLTGIILYLKPPGRIANWINWTLWGFDKHQWQALHTIFSFTFVIFSLLHLFWINWKGFWSYMVSKKNGGFNKLKEFVISIVVVLFIGFGTHYQIPPFSYIMDYGEYLSESWDIEENNPPIPHAEDFSLDELDAQLEELTLGDIKKILNKNQIKFDSTQQTLEEIGINNNLTPNKLYEIITQQETKKQNGSGMMQGSGMGRKTLGEFADELGIDVNLAIENLERAGYFGEANETLKDIASNNDVSPKDIFDIINKQE